MVKQEYLLSLPTAILININIMLGTGIFINMVELSKRAGALGAFMYLAIAVFILPLIISIAILVKRHPSGGFFIFAKEEMSPFAGFVSAWSYFTGKLASAMLMIHVAAQFLQQIIIPLQLFNVFFLDICIVIIFVMLNLLNIRLGSYIQLGFLSLKLMPVLAVIAAGLCFFNVSFATSTTFLSKDIISGFPLILYAALGFEATASLSTRLIDSQKNGPKAIYYSFAMAMGMIFLFQFLLYALLGSQLEAMPNFLSVFPEIVMNVFNLSGIGAQYLIALFHVAIAASALGGAYGILYSNCWNLHILAQQKYLWKWQWFEKLNHAGVPLFAIILEGFLCLLYLGITKGAQIPLQQISVLSSVIAYLLSVIALLVAVIKKRMDVSLWIPFLGLVSCSFLSIACMRNFFISGFFALLLFVGLGIVGISMYFYSRKTI